MFCIKQPFYILISFHFCFRLLNHISEIKHSPNAEEDLIKFLTAVYSSNVPDPGTTLQVPFNNGESVSVVYFYFIFRAAIFLWLWKKGNSLICWLRDYTNI